MSVLRLRQLVNALGFFTLILVGVPARASFHLWQIDEIFSDASGTLQYVELSTSASGEQFLSGHSITATSGSAAHVFTFPNDLPGSTANRHFLVATEGFATLHLVTPDYVVPNGFLFIPGGTLNYAGVDSVSYASLPSDGVHSIDRNGNVMVNSPTNLAGQTGSVSPPATATTALENPQPASFQSGIGLLSGWSCQAGVGVSIDGGQPLALPYGSSRNDTAGICGANNTNTGFGSLVNFNLLGAGPHTAQLIVNGQPQGAPTPFTVVVPAGEFLTGVTREVTVTDFPASGKTTILIWQQSQQNFAVKSVTP